MSLYQSSTIGTTANQIVFNDTSERPYFRVQSRSPQRRQLRELDIPVPFENGISDFETNIGQVYYVINGTMYPGSEHDADIGVAKLRKLASLEVAQDDNLSDHGYVPYTWTETTANKQLNLKVLYVNVQDNVKQGLIKQFSLICKIKDPTIFSSDLGTATTAPADITGTLGAFVFPVVLPEAFGASVYSTSATATNDGDIAVYPIGINIYGPCINPRIVNNRTGEYLEVNGVTLTSSSNILSFAYDKDTLSVTQDGTNVLSKVTNTSTYFKLQPGGNTFTLTGSTISDGSYATVQYRSGWPLS